jgi:hypothetical protein
MQEQTLWKQRGGRSLSHKDVAGAWSRQSLGGVR